MKKFTAELIGTFWLVLGGCGSAMLAAGVPNVGIGFVGVSLAFGLTVLTGAYALGHLSGAHFNPAVSLGLWIGGRFEAKELGSYIAAQIIGGILAASVLYVIVTGNGSDIGGFAASVYKRGIPHCNVPTTLLGMIDAAIGGKTGIDFMGLKNIIGSGIEFAQRL